MTYRALRSIVALLIACTLGAAGCGGGGRVAAAGASSAAKKAWSRVLTRDAARDARSPVTRITRDRLVHRYVTAGAGRRELAAGIGAGRHLTARAPAGRPLGASAAQRRFGLPQRPEVRLSVRLPRGTAVRGNKVIGGQPGYGELTPVRKIPKEQITRVTSLGR